MISRTLITDSGMTLWNATYDKPPEEMPFSEATRKIMTEALIFQHRPKISRVVFLSPSHRGADLATKFLGRLGSMMIGSPKDLRGTRRCACGLREPVRQTLTVALPCRRASSQGVERFRD